MYHRSSMAIAEYIHNHMSPAPGTTPLYVFEARLPLQHPGFQGYHCFLNSTTRHPSIHTRSHAIEDVPIHAAFDSISILKQFIVGPAGSGAPPHFHGHAANHLVFGQKEWLVHTPPQSFFAFTPGITIVTQSIRPIHCFRISG